MISSRTYYQEWKERVEIERPARDEAWSARTFGVTDPAGNLIFVVGPMETEGTADGQEGATRWPAMCRALMEEEGVS